VRPLRHPYAKARLVSVRFEVLPDDEIAADADKPLITVEDNAFISWWKPTWSERIKILCGCPVRVLVNYSSHGPLYLDVSLSWGSSRLIGR
jgi:hypothetical protein